MYIYIYTVAWLVYLTHYFLYISTTLVRIALFQRRPHVKLPFAVQRRSFSASFSSLNCLSGNKDTFCSVSHLASDMQEFIIFIFTFSLNCFLRLYIFVGFYLIYSIVAIMIYMIYSISIRFCGMKTIYFGSN